MFWIAGAVGLLVAYLFGSTPTGYLVGKLLRGIDLREHGSGSTGATNALRTLGRWPALLVLVFDVLKGASAIVFASWYFSWLSALPSVHDVGQRRDRLQPATVKHPLFRHWN